MRHKFFEDKIPHNGMTYREFTNKTIDQLAEVNPDQLSESDRKIHEFVDLNLKRSTRLDKHFNVSEETKDIVNKLVEPQLWMIITENWCGDSAQILPVISKIAEVNSRIDLRIIERDNHPEIMDLYLTNGSRSIPKLIAFDEDGNELFTWGPRPADAVEIVRKGKEEGLPKKEWQQNLHLWYGRNRGKEIEREIRVLVQQSVEKSIEV